MSKKRVFPWSKVVGCIEQLTYFCPTIGTVLYYYFANIRETVSVSSRYSFALAVALAVLFVTYRAVAKTKIAELRQATVQTETDLKNEVDAEKLKKLATNAEKSRRKLDFADRGGILIGLVIFALAVHILESALIGLTTLAVIACGSVAAGFGIHIGVLALQKREVVKRGVEL